MFRVAPLAVAPEASDQWVMIRLWSIECLDPSDPDAIALLGDLPSRVSQVEGRFDPDAIAAHLESLLARGKLYVRCQPTITVMAGESATVAITEPVEKIAHQPEQERDNGAFTFERGERFSVRPVIDPDGSVMLGLDYHLEMAGSGSIQPDPNVLAYRVDPAVRLRSGESVVLGGLPMPGESRDGSASESVLLLVVNVCAIPTPAQQARARRVSTN